MTRSRRIAPLALLLAAGVAWADPGPESPADAQTGPAAPPKRPPRNDAVEAAFDAVLLRMEQAAESVRDLVYTFHRQEWVDGAMREPETLLVKYRVPLDLYLIWTGEVHRGREVLYREGWNDGLLRVTLSGPVPAANVDPAGALAMRKNRHPLTDLPIPRTVEKIRADRARTREHPEYGSTAIDLGEKSLWGEPAHCFESWLAKEREPAYWAPRVELCFDGATGLPARVRSWDVEDGAFRLTEDYGYEAIRVNVGLTDLDFDPDNPAYGF